MNATSVLLSRFLLDLFLLKFEIEDEVHLALGHLAQLVAQAGMPGILKLPIAPTGFRHWNGYLPPTFSPGSLDQQHPFLPSS